MAERILIINRRHLGDLLMSTAALSLLRRIRPNAHITVVVPEAYTELLEDSPLIDRVIGERLPKRRFLKSLHKTASALRYRYARYDACFLFGESPTNARRLQLLANIPERICAATDLNGRPNEVTPFCTCAVEAGSVWTTHVAEYFQNLIRTYYNASGTESMWLATKNANASKEDSSLPIGNSGKRIALCFDCSPTNLNSWPDRAWRFLLHALHGAGHTLFHFSPTPAAQRVKTIVSASQIPILIKTTTLTQCVDFLRQMDLLISVDTGQVHMATALGIPVLSLAGSTVKGTSPYTHRGIALSTTAGCFECPFIQRCPSNRKTGRHHAPGWVPPCMEALSPVDALLWAEKLLQQPSCEKSWILVPPAPNLTEKGEKERAENRY